ncbi:hypothetical protein HBH52_103410 [Parastagonospora nodorum]|nr:hypothetical protein HBH52_103410 [Parastagonospora nodorum]
MPSVAFISNVYIANSLRARTLINLSAVLYDNIDLNFVPSITFISNVYIANSLRIRTLINLSAVLYKQAAAQTSLSAEVSNIFLRARTLINLSAVLYEQISIIDLNFVPSVAFNAIGNVELTGDFLTALLNLRLLALKRSVLSSSDLNCRRTNPTIATRNNHNNLNIIVTNPTSREFSRVDIKSLTRLFISKLDKVPTQELSSYIKTELLRDNSRKFYYLIITSEDTHYKQIIKKAYIMLLERALLILFII